MDEQKLQVTDRQQQSSSPNMLTDEDRQVFSAWRKMLSVCSNRDDCLFGNHPTLQEMDNTCKGSGIAAISQLLELMNAYTNKAELDQKQRLTLSVTIYDKFFYLKETEVMLFFCDYFKYSNSDEFYGALEPKTINTMLTRWVRVTRGKAIWEHENLLKEQKKESEKPFLMTWDEYRQKNENISVENPLDRFFSGFGRKKTVKDTKDTATESAQALIENKWGYDDDAMKNARRSFVCRYGYTPEDYLRKEGKYV